MNPLSLTSFVKRICSTRSTSKIENLMASCRSSIWKKTHKLCKQAKRFSILNCNRCRTLTWGCSTPQLQHTGNQLKKKTIEHFSIRNKECPYYPKQAQICNMMAHGSTSHFTLKLGAWSSWLYSSKTLKRVLLKGNAGNHLPGRSKKNFKDKSTF